MVIRIDNRAVLVPPWANDVMITHSAACLHYDCQACCPQVPWARNAVAWSNIQETGAEDVTSSLETVTPLLLHLSDLCAISVQTAWESVSRSWLWMLSHVANMMLASGLKFCWYFDWGPSYNMTVCTCVHMRQIRQQVLKMLSCLHKSFSHKCLNFTCVESHCWFWMNCTALMPIARRPV